MRTAPPPPSPCYSRRRSVRTQCPQCPHLLEDLHAEYGFPISIFRPCRSSACMRKSFAPDEQAKDRGQCGQCGQLGKRIDNSLRLYEFARRTPPKSCPQLVRTCPHIRISPRIDQASANPPVAKLVFVTPATVTTRRSLRAAAPAPGYRPRVAVGHVQGPLSP